jgi:hypothetical protein
MFTNNQKISSFYPTIKRPNNNSFNYNSPPIVNVNKTFSISNKPDTNNEPILSDSVRLALYTVNLTFARFKTMDLNELEFHVKTMIFNNNLESTKYSLALNILKSEMNKSQIQIIHQQSFNNTNKSQIKHISDNKININDSIFIEPDEFNLDLCSTDNYTSNTQSSFKNNDSFSIKQHSNNNLNNNTSQKMPIPIKGIINQENNNINHNNLAMKRRTSNLDVGTSNNYVIIK